MALALMIAACASLAAQAPAFDVASIKRTAPDVRISEFQMRPGGRLVVLGMTLRDLIRRAYAADGIERNDQLQSEKGAVAYVVVDRAEPPTEN